MKALKEAFWEVVNTAIKALMDFIDEMRR